jgi:hypothetical protein
MKILTLVSFGILTDIVYSSMGGNQNYIIKKNVKFSQLYNLTYLIDSSQKQLLLFCLASCNSNPNCLAIVFLKNGINLNTGNCFLYSKIFQDIELSVSMGSDLYVKKISYNITELNIRLLNGE